MNFLEGRCSRLLESSAGPAPCEEDLISDTIQV